MRVTSKGQVTIPQSIREQFGIQPGAEVRFEIDGETPSGSPSRLTPTAVAA